MNIEDRDARSAHDGRAAPGFAKMALDAVSGLAEQLRLERAPRVRKSLEFELKAAAPGGFYEDIGRRGCGQQGRESAKQGGDLEIDDPAVHEPNRSAPFGFGARARAALRDRDRIAAPPKLQPYSDIRQSVTASRWTWMSSRGEVGSQGLEDGTIGAPLVDRWRHQAALFRRQDEPDLTRSARAMHRHGEACPLQPLGGAEIALQVHPGGSAESTRLSWWRSRTA